VPEGARWETRRYDGPEGSRDYRLFVPEGDAPHGLLVMLHGCTQDPEDFARGTRMNHAAARAGLAVAWPQQGPAHNMQSCWNWFRPEDQRREGGEPAILAALARGVAAELDLPEGRMAVAGLSAGGAMAAILAVTHPDLFVAAGVHSGLPAGAARDVGSAFAAMRAGAAGTQGDGAPLIVLHGTADATVSAANAEALVPPGGAETAHAAGGRRWTRRVAPSGSELWRVEGAGHAWFGGDTSGSYADPQGPDASAEIVRFARARMG
jgi:poly(hydroxyalkanoate) depolymerase family esterase